MPKLYVDGGFVVVPDAVLSAKISPQAFRLWCTLASFGRTTGVRFPSLATVAEKMGVSAPTVKRASTELAEAGFLRKVQRRGGTGRMSSNDWCLYMEPHRGSRMIPGGTPPGITDDPPPRARVLNPVTQRRLRTSDGGRARTPSDDIWDALVEATGITPQSKNERSRFGKSVKELIELGATPEEIKARWGRWQKKHKPDVVGASTERALLAHWGELASTRRSSSTDAVCPDCALAMPAAKIKEHRYVIHEIGYRCPDCDEITEPGEEHPCTAVA